MAGSLNAFRSLLRRSKESCDDIDFVFQILGFYCYVADKTYLRSFPGFLSNSVADCKIEYLYDVVITDGSSKLKCLLANCLNSLVQQNVIKVGCKIHITQAWLTYRESDFHASSYVVLQKLEVQEINELPENELKFLNTEPRESQPIPLTTGRLYYLNTWITTIPYGPSWKNTDSCFVHQDSESLIQTPVSLSYLEKNWKTEPKPYPPLIVIVLLVGKLNHYGSNKLDAKLPFQGYLEVADETNTCTVVLWNKSAVEFFYQISPGTILLLQKYDLGKKPERQGSPSFRKTCHTLPRSSIEVKLNASALIKFVPSSAEILQNLHLPTPEYWFATRKTVGQLPPGVNVDIVGLVTHVGRYTRQLPKDRNRYLFDVYQWLELVDASSPLPFRVKLYLNHEAENHNSLHPGKVIVCTQLVTVHGKMSSSRCLRSVYLVSTCETQLYTVLEVNQQFEKYKEVVDVQKLQSDEAFLRKSMFTIGGVYLFPPFPQELDHVDFMQSFTLAPEENLFISFVPGASWKNEVSSMSYREHRTIMIKGTVAQVDFVNLSLPASHNSPVTWLNKCEPNSRYTLYLDVRLHNVLCQSVQVGSRNAHFDTIPLHYTPEHKDLLLQWLQFPPFSYDQERPSPAGDISALQGICHCYYVVSIVNLSDDTVLNCLLFPEPAVNTYPSFMQLLTGDFAHKLPINTGGQYLESPSYTWKEMINVQATSSEIWSTKMKFFIDLYSHGIGKVEAIIRRAFPWSKDVSCLSRDCTL